jgi:hypothetical protein
LNENAGGKREYSRETKALRLKYLAAAKQPNEMALYAKEGKRGEIYNPCYANPRVPQRRAGPEELIAITLI